MSDLKIVIENVNAPQCTAICEHCGKVISDSICRLDNNGNEQQIHMDQMVYMSWSYECYIDDVFGNRYVACPHCGEKFHSYEIIVKEKKEMNLTVNLKNLTKSEKNQLLNLVEKASKEKPKGLWKPEHGEKYYMVALNGTVDIYVWSNDRIDQNLYTTGNCFKTKGEAEHYIEKLKVIHELQEYAALHNEGKIDWSNDEQTKWYFCYNKFAKILITYLYNHQCYQTCYFTSRQIAEDAIEEIGEERIIKYLFDVEVE